MSSGLGPARTSGEGLDCLLDDRPAQFVTTNTEMRSHPVTQPLSETSATTCMEVPTAPTNLPPSSRRNVERGLRELRAWLAMARQDLREAIDLEERVHLRLFVTDLEDCAYQLEMLLHPANGENR